MVKTKMPVKKKPSKNKGFNQKAYDAQKAKVFSLPSKGSQMQGMDSPKYYSKKKK